LLLLLRRIATSELLTSAESGLSLVSPALGDLDSEDLLDDGAAEEVAEEGGLLLVEVLLGLGDVLDDGELRELLLQLRLLRAVATDDGEGLPLGGRQSGADGQAQDQEASHRCDRCARCRTGVP
jgi:hypothetical protein